MESCLQNVFWYIKDYGYHETDVGFWIIAQTQLGIRLKIFQHVKNLHESLELGHLWRG